MSSSTGPKEVVSELLPLVRFYSDGTVERLVGSDIVEPTTEDTVTGVSSKDVSVSPNISARLYLPKLTSQAGKKLPILIYFHGGGFCVESAFSFLHQRYLNRLVDQAGVLAVSVEFRQAPEHPLPIAYDDSWTALRWVSSHLVDDDDDVSVHREQWLSDHGDFNRLYIGGDATGANIAHNMVVRAGSESLLGDVKILGAFLSLPVFWGSTPVRSEPETGHLERMICRVWEFVYPSAAKGIDNPMINPFGSDLSGLGCSRLLVCVGEKDSFKERGIHYCDVVRESGWEGEIELYEAEGGGHGFHISYPETEIAKKMIQKLASFLS
ncbi:2-hydroxyisoflavanone dehydratase-like [Impatiens glandulifera]|uniref:2-hydroxyisoflavanone dehydratase-like n=1 Tax=Impatiens glandulifera TaxID=253017 RepID=UPI001FB151A7|nr:2-hydroxyisoflavanone dehydratase-like [Impatiens glandulifera]